MSELLIKQILTACIEKPHHIFELCSITGESKQRISYNINEKPNGSLTQLGYLESKDKAYVTTTKGKEWLSHKEKEIRDSILESQQKEEKRKESVLEVANRVFTYKSFLEEKYTDQIELLRNTNKPIEINFSDILFFSPDLANFFYDEPEESIKSIELALVQIYDVPRTISIKNFSIRPKPIGDLRHEDYEKLVCIRGIIAQRGEPRPQVQKIKYECPSCASNQSILQTQRRITRPKKCHSCGYTGGFTVLGKDFRTVQVLKVEELGEDVGSRAQPSDIYVILENSLCDSNMQHLYNCGNVIKIFGVVREREKKEKDSVDFDQIMYACSVEGESQDLDLQIKPEEKTIIAQVSSKKDYVQKIVDSFAPGVSESDDMKEAILLQAVSTTVGDSRGIIHVAFVGDPATGKSTLAKEYKKIIPRSRYVSGESASQVGLTASAEKDELTGAYVLKAGALPLANNSVCIIDELDKLKEKDALHGALEAGEINIDKAGIHARLRANTAVLVTLNPKYGRFDRNDSFLKQIDISQPLLTRFDCIFIQTDIAGSRDKNVARSILGHKEEKERILSSEVLTKYLWKAKQVQVTLDDNTKKYLEDYYVRQRKNLVNPEVGFYFNPRHFAGIVRLTVCYAKLQFRNLATVDDADRAISLFNRSLKSIQAFNPTAMQEFEVGTGFVEKELVDKTKVILQNGKKTTADIIDELRLLAITHDEQSISKVLFKYNTVEWFYEKGLWHLMGVVANGS